MADNYDSRCWYWLVGNRPGVVFSAMASGYVALTDAGYKSWAARGNVAPTNVPLYDGELADVLLRAGCPAVLVEAAGITDFGTCGSGLTLADATAVLTAIGYDVGNKAVVAALVAWSDGGKWSAPAKPASPI